MKLSSQRGAVLLLVLVVDHTDGTLARRLKVDFPIFYISTPYPKTQMRAELEEMGLVTNSDFTRYDGLHANLKTKHLSEEEVAYITWQMNARYYDREWFWYNKVKKLYPR